MESLARIRIVLADDHLVVREGIRHLLNSERDFVVAGEAGDGVSACALAQTLSPDVLVLDLSAPAGALLETVRMLRAAAPGVPVIALTVREDRASLHALLDAGVAGYVLKRSESIELFQAIRAVVAGRSYIDPSIANMLIEGFITSHNTPDAGEEDALSEREREVLIRIARGFRNTDIAAELEISVKTVETYKSRMLEKLGLRSRVDIVRFAADRGWLA